MKGGEWDGRASETGAQKKEREGKKNMTLALFIIKSESILMNLIVLSNLINYMAEETQGEREGARWQKKIVVCESTHSSDKS